MTGRAQCVVLRGDKLLMARHRQGGETWWCLPGGGIEPNENPEAAAIRELKEECGVHGRVLRKISYVVYSETNVSHTFLIDIGDQEPIKGTDPEFAQDKQILAEIRWMFLSEIPERDRAYLWAFGLLGVKALLAVVEGWGDALSYPGAEVEPRAP